MRRSLEELSNIKDGNEKPQWVDDRPKEAIKGDDDPEIKPNGRRKTRFEKLKKGADVMKKEDFHEKRKSIALAKGRGSLTADDPIKEK